MLGKWLDSAVERATRRQARLSSRRSVLSRFGLLVIGAGFAPLLPVFRASAFAEAPGIPEEGNPNHCSYWRYCAMDGTSVVVAVALPLPARRAR